MNCSFVIPSYNEENFLPRTIDALTGAIRKANGIKKWEIIVVDNNSTDKTASVAQQKGAVVVHEPIRQIAKARNTGANHALSLIHI